MSNYTDIQPLEEALISLSTRIADKDIIISKLKDIPYGVQISGEATNGAQGKITCYFSKKKGLSATDNSKNSVSATMITYFHNKENEVKKAFRPTIGSDEAGKGDFFGPLTVAAFYIENEEMEQELLKLGIRDSKKLSDAKIKAMATEMYKRWPNHYVVLAPGVAKYNELYQKFGNLNLQLGWMHSTAITDLVARCQEKKSPVDGIIIDKFADISNVLQFNPELKKLPISAVTHGEEAEVAIAAASIIARNHFLFKMGMLNKEFDMTIPLGAGPQVKVVGREFINRYGRNHLKEVAKTHFKTAKEL